jgi:hypothetical protein
MGVIIRKSYNSVRKVSILDEKVDRINSQKNKGSKKRAQIVATAEDLFSRLGAKRVTVEEICRRAGVSDQIGSARGGQGLYSPPLGALNAFDDTPLLAAG